MLTLFPDSPDSSCSADEFRCATSGACIPARLRCDGVAQCADLSDELACGGERRRHRQEEVSEDEEDEDVFPCETGFVPCVPMRQR